MSYLHYMLYLVFTDERYTQILYKIILLCYFIMIKIRNAKPEDVKDITNVFYQAYIITYPNDIIDVSKEDIYELFKDAYSESKLIAMADHIKNIPSNCKYMVATDGENIIGLCKIFNKENFNQLQSIYVLPSYQGQGIGRMFWSEALKFFDKNKKIIVQVATYNEKAIKFYESLGFKDNEKRFSEEKHRMPISKVLIPEMEMEVNFPI